VTVRAKLRIWMFGWKVTISQIATGLLVLQRQVALA
jgi:hypothetical protein